MIIINDGYRLLKGGKVNEGGMARIGAIIEWLKNEKNAGELKLDRNKIINAISVIHFLLCVKNETVICFYPAVGLPILKKGIIGRFSSWLFISLLRKTCTSNRVIIDISDLKYEQAKDLEIYTDRLAILDYLERGVFSLDSEFLFASGSMRNYAIGKYRISSERSYVLDNGGDFAFCEIRIPDHHGKRRLIYSGTLNKGRQIEKMIDVVSNIPNTVLYLCGRGGEWIESNDNCVYLGALDEDKAHYLVSKCDIGLIPYDETRMYYNIAYPTKLGFYITAGVPFLSTDVGEVRVIQEKYDIGYIGSIADWGTILNTIGEEDIKSQKDRIELVKTEFTWDYKCRHSILNTL